MNRAERRHPNKAKKIMRFLNDMSMAQKFKEAMENGPPIKDGEKVTINLARIKSRQEYNKLLEGFRKFCEENKGVVFTAEYENSLNQSVVHLKEDTSDPKWLFWIGDLKIVKEDQDGTGN